MRSIRLSTGTETLGITAMPSTAVCGADSSVWRGMTGTFTNGMLGQANLGNVLGFSGQNIGDISGLNNFVGGLAGHWGR